MDVIDFLIENNLSISCAESCTGGLLSAKFIARPGVSKIFREAIIAYSDISKIERLGVSMKTLDKFGAVSKQVAIEMLSNLKTDIAVSITGLAGPNSDKSNKPVGLIYIGLKIKNNTFVREFNFEGTREVIQKRAVDAALDFLEKKLTGA